MHWRRRHKESMEDETVRVALSAIRWRLEVWRFTIEHRQRLVEAQRQLNAELDEIDRQERAS